LKKSNKKLTSSQIAQLAGVSRSTVSRVINNYSNVPEATYNRVINIIKENNYYPHLSGQLLAGKKSKTIGFFWVKEKNCNSIAEDQLSGSYLVQVIEAAARANYLMLTCIVENLVDKKNVDYISKIFMQGRIDAGIFIGVNNNEPLINELVTNGHIIGVFDYYNPKSTVYNLISVNYEQDVGNKIIEYLYNLGHRKIALIHGNPSRYSSENRKQSFLSTLQKYNLPIKNEWQAIGGIYEQTGYETAKEMFRKLKSQSNMPTAICATNDAVAFGVYQALQGLDIKIPQQISVTGIDGHSHNVTPALTTYAFDYYKVFNSLITRTIAAIENKSQNLTTEFINGGLIVRDSCCCVDL